MSPIDIFVWNNRFNTGLEELDAQHLRLIQLLNRVAGQLALAPEDSELLPVLGELTDYAEYHFRFEEALWARYLGGQNCERDHRKSHADFGRMVERFLAAYQQQPVQETLERLLDYLVRWLAAHILESDQRFAFIVLAMRDGQSLEEAQAAADAGMQGAARALIEIILSVYASLSQNTISLMRELAARAERERQLQLAASVFEHANEGIMITDPEATILEVNAAFTRITGYSRDEAIGQNVRLLKSGRHSPDFYRGMWQSLQSSSHWSGEIWGRRRDGELFAKLQTISAVRGEDGSVLRYVALFTDITKVKDHQQQLEHVAHYDPLTHLPNRVLLSDRLQQAMARVQRQQGTLAVASLDLDGFKDINERHGHALGDRLLVLLASRMRQWLRDGDTLARLGGDEFIVVLQDLQGHDAARPILERLLQSVALPLDAEGVEVSVTASLGLTFFQHSDAGVDADQLLRQADQAMFQAKRAGKNRIQIFDAAEDRMMRGRMEQLARIREALEHNEFVLHFQPKVRMRSGEVVGVEALIRWRHPQRGLLPPAQFLPLLEGDPFGVELDHWVLETALGQVQAWRDAGLVLPVSVNVSAQQLNQPDFLERLQAALMRHPRVKVGDLELEVLETSALEDLARVAALVDGSRALGVRFALDDFGTGYSSLAYLKQLNADLLKVDQSFVRDSLDDPDDLAILDAVQGLARAFRCDVLAEGVETVAHGELLLQLGYELAQGYAIARPMAAEELPGWLNGWRPDAAWQRRRRLGRDELPVLVAMVDHRAWVASLRRHLEGYQGLGPELNPLTCQFGQWLAQAKLGRWAAQPLLAEAEQLHTHIHERARLLVARPRVRGTVDEAALREIETLRDTLVFTLQSMLEAAVA